MYNTEKQKKFTIKGFGSNFDYKYAVCNAKHLLVANESEVVAYSINTDWAEDVAVDNA